MVDLQFKNGSFPLFPLPDTLWGLWHILVCSKLLLTKHNSLYQESVRHWNECFCFIQNWKYMLAPFGSNSCAKNTVGAIPWYTFLCPPCVPKSPSQTKVCFWLCKLMRGNLRGFPSTDFLLTASSSLKAIDFATTCEHAMARKCYYCMFGECCMRVPSICVTGKLWNQSLAPPTILTVYFFQSLKMKTIVY